MAQLLQQGLRLQGLRVVGHVGIVSSKVNDCSSTWPLIAVGAPHVNGWLTTSGGGRTLRNVANLSEQVALTQLQDRLSSAYADIPADRLQSAMRNAEARFEHSKIRDFVPLLIERRVRAELANA
jgi:hypothetical protein